MAIETKKQLWVILNSNIVTQLALNIGLLIGGYSSIFFFYVIQYFIWEVLIFAAEALVYKSTLEKYEEPYQKKKHPVGYAFTANLASFVMGYVISQWFPFVF